jgi:hypothetical protein
MAILEIAPSLERQRAAAWRMWQNRLAGVLTRAVFAGVSGRHAMVVVRTIGVSPEGLAVDLGSQTITAEAIPRVLVFCEKAAELMRTDPIWKNLAPGRLAYELMRAAVAAPHGPDSGSAAYVTVIKVGKSGATWLHRGACFDEARRAGFGRGSTAASPAYAQFLRPTITPGL